MQLKVCPSYLLLCLILHHPVILLAQSCYRLLQTLASHQQIFSEYEVCSLLPFAALRSFGFGQDLITLPLASDLGAGPP